MQLQSNFGSARKRNSLGLPIWRAAARMESQRLCRFRIRHRCAWLRGVFEARFTLSACNAGNSLAAVSNRCVGRQSCSVPAENEIFGDPCLNKVKRLYIQATCKPQRRSAQTACGKSCHLQCLDLSQLLSRASANANHSGMRLSRRGKYDLGPDNGSAFRMPLFGSPCPLTRATHVFLRNWPFVR